MHFAMVSEATPAALATANVHVCSADGDEADAVPAHSGIQDNSTDRLQVDHC